MVLDLSQASWKRWWERTRSILRGLGPAGPWLLVAGGGPLLGLLFFAASSSVWLSWFGQGLDSVLTFGVVAALLAAFCLIPTHVTSLVAGYIFGALCGASIGLLAVILAAIIGFQVWSKLVGNRVLEAIAETPSVARVHRSLLRRSFWKTTFLIALLRLSPVMPFAATNLLMASFGVRPLAFLVATIIGVAPRSIGVSIVGAGLADFDWEAGGSWWSTVVAIVATILIISLISRSAKRALAHETEFVDESVEGGIGDEISR